MLHNFLVFEGWRHAGGIHISRLKEIFLDKIQNYFIQLYKMWYAEK